MRRADIASLPKMERGKLSEKIIHCGWAQGSGD